MSQIMYAETDDRKRPEGFKSIDLNWTGLELCEVCDNYGNKSDIYLFAPIDDIGTIQYESAYWSKTAKNDSDFNLEVPLSIVFQLIEIDSNDPVYTIDDNFCLFGFAPITVDDWNKSEKINSELEEINSELFYHDDLD